MHTPTRWGLRAFLAATAAVSGCSGPLTSDAWYERLERRGVPRPDDASVQAQRADTPTADVEAGLPDMNITLNDLFRVAEARNPGLRATQAAAGVAGGRAWQAGRYPNPSVAVTAGEVGFEGDSSNTVLSITQPLVLGSRLRDGVGTAESQLEARLAGVERARRELLGEVAGLHAALLSVRAEMDLLDELLVLAQRTLDIAETRFEARAVTEPDVTRPRVEVFRLRADRSRLARRLESHETRLGLLLDRGPVRAETIASALPTLPPELDAAALRAGVERTHPALLAGEHAIEAARLELERARSSRTPDLDVTLGVGYSEEGDQGIAEIGLGTELPLWDRGRGDIASARFTLMQRRQEQREARNRLLAELAAAQGAYDGARDQLALVRDDIIPEARRSFEQIDASYRAGRASFLELLDAQRTLMEARRLQIELAGDAAVARARIATVCGPDTLNTQSHLLAPTDSPTQEAPDGAEDRP